MNRYSPELFSDLQKLTAKRFDTIKPLKLDLVQFYAFMLQRCLGRSKPKIPRGNIKLGPLLNMLETEYSNPLSVYIYPDIEYLPDGDITWSINKYE